MSDVKAVRCLALLSLLAVLGCSSSTSSESAGPPAPSDSLPALSAVTDGVEPGRIVDSAGREVLLRGVNVNAHVDYWQYDPDLFIAYPFTEADADMIAAMGWNMVRLLLSWSRVEPRPGEYDEAYLDEYAESVAMLRERGVYTLLDLHQDAWGPSLVAPPDEVCPDSEPAGGWDGAPDWATFDDGEPRCERAERELVPAVRAAWVNFFNNREGPGGVGIQTRYVQMFAHLVKRFAHDDSVAGYDLMNEPNQFLPENAAKLSQFYEDALRAMREAEAEVGAPTRLFFFESSIAWNAIGLPAPPPFDHDDQVVFSPHIYQGGIDPGTLEEGFARAAEETVRLYDGAPVVTSEWGSSPERAKDPVDDYFERHLREQDNYLFGATIWTWREACGDAHKYVDAREGRVPYVWGYFDVNCENNTVEGNRTEYTDVMRKIAVRFAPGALSEVDWSPDDTGLAASGEDARAGNRLEVFVPTDDPSSVDIESTGLGAIESVPWFGGTLFYARADGAPWSIRLSTVP
ncbi:MAG: cellulase family glycosylhydrolase [Myxococcales bacterium]|nr:cellulase family glycosylhydrolase [Myxococcales bacterium]